MEQAKEFVIYRLGDCVIPSPMTGVMFTRDKEHILLHSGLNEMMPYLDASKRLLIFEAVGSRDNFFFNSAKLTCGIVTCGGLCLGLNDIIRSIVISLNHRYGVQTVYGFRYGYEGLVPKYGHRPIMLTPEVLGSINEMGGTLEQMEIGILFCIGGDSTQRGALAISDEATRRGLHMSIVGIPKTIDNDISYVQKTFGFETAVSEAKKATSAAYAEAVTGQLYIAILVARLIGFYIANELKEIESKR